MPIIPRLPHFFACAMLCSGCTLAELPAGAGPNTVSTETLAPSPVKFGNASPANPRLPAGFKFNVFSKDMQHARWIQTAGNIDRYLSGRRQVDVLLQRATNRDDKIDSQKVVAQNIRNVHAILVQGNFMSSDRGILGDPPHSGPVNPNVGGWVASRGS